MICVADSDPRVTAAIADALRSKHQEVCIAHTVEDAKCAIRTEHPTVLVVSVDLPVNGLARMLSLGRVRIIALTHSDGRLHHGRASVFTTFFREPLCVNGIVDACLS